jgi:hypothetical protein
MMPAPRIVGLVFLVAAGCVGGESAPPREPVVHDLLTQFRAFHQEGAGVLTELREKYSLLLLKVLALLQAGDPVLARAIAASREAIWSLLEDPAKFATL